MLPIDKPRGPALEKLLPNFWTGACSALSLNFNSWLGNSRHLERVTLLICSDTELVVVAISWVYKSQLALRTLGPLSVYSFPVAERGRLAAL